MDDVLLGLRHPITPRHCCRHGSAASATERDVTGGTAGGAAGQLLAATRAVERGREPAPPAARTSRRLHRAQAGLRHGRLHRGRMMMTHRRQISAAGECCVSRFCWTGAAVPTRCVMPLFCHFLQRCCAQNY